MIYYAFLISPPEQGNMFDFGFKERRKFFINISTKLRKMLPFVFLLDHAIRIFMSKVHERSLILYGCY